MPRLSIIIPTYNEEKNIAATINFILSYFDANRLDSEIIVSDDGSSDATPEIVAKISRKNSTVKYLINTHQGKASALNSGVQVAQGTNILLMDADGATEIGEVNKLLFELKEKGADIAIGSREGRTAERIGEPFYRHLMGRIFNKVVKIITGLPFEDTQCGFKLFRADVIKKLSEKSTIMNRKFASLKKPMVTAFDVELLVIAKVLGYKVVEVPIEWRYVPSHNINPIEDSLKMFSEVLKIRFNLTLGSYEKEG